MCRYNMSFNDAVMNELRPHFKDEESLLVWLRHMRVFLDTNVILEFFIERKEMLISRRMVEVTKGAFEKK